MMQSISFHWNSTCAISRRQGSCLDRPHLLDIGLLQLGIISLLNLQRPRLSLLSTAQSQKLLNAGPYV